MVRRGRRPNYSKRNRKEGERFTHETDTYKGEVKTGNYVVVKNKNTPDNNLIFTEKKRLKEFIGMLNDLKSKL